MSYLYANKHINLVEMIKFLEQEETTRARRKTDNVNICERNHSS